MNFVEAKHYTKGPRSNPVDLAVVHSMESAEMGDTAEACARYFATTDRPASAHVCADNNSRVRCVRDSDISYAAPGANHNGVHLELAGRAAQSRAEWLDDYGQGLLDQGAGQLAEWVTSFDLPVRFVDAAGLLRGDRGITTHAEVSKAFKRSTHTDPGSEFPMDVLLDRVRALLSPKEDDMPATFTSRDKRYDNIFVEPWGGTVSSLPAGKDDADELFEHDGRLASLVWRTWGLAVQEAIDVGLLKKRGG